MRRLIRRGLVILALVFVSSVVMAGPAHADLCKDAPAPVSPKAGLPGLVTTTPDKIPSSAPDPFKDRKIPIGDVYGYGWHWANYDLGCGSDFLRDPGAVTNTGSGNLLLSISDGMTASLASMETTAKGSSLAWLTKPLQEIGQSLKGPILTMWFPTATLALACLVLWRARKASYGEVAKALAVFAAAAALAVFALLYPTVLSAGVDKAVTATAEVTGSTFSASATDAVNRESGYRTWLTGNFGDPDSATANKYGPRLMSATHYTWSDWQRIEHGPTAKEDIDKAKSTEFKAIADELEESDPAAYEVFTGRGERTGPALFGVLNVAAMGLFIGLAALMVLTARVMMQALTLIAPIVAVMGILPKFHSVLANLWDLFTASIIAVAKFTLAGGIMAVVLGAVQSANMSGSSRLFFVVVATIVGIVLTKPIRSLKTIIPGMDPNHSYLKKLVQHVGPALAGGIGAGVGVNRGIQDAATQPDMFPWLNTLVPSNTPPVSTPPLPRPAWHWPAEDPVQLPQAREPLLALPAAPLIIEGATVPQETTAAPAEPSETPVVPDGVIVQAEPGQYHPGAPPEEYVPRSDFEMADDGTQHEQIVYHADSDS